MWWIVIGSGSSVMYRPGGFWSRTPPWISRRSPALRSARTRYSRSCRISRPSGSGGRIESVKNIVTPLDVSRRSRFGRNGRPTTRRRGHRNWKPSPSSSAASNVNMPMPVWCARPVISERTVLWSPIVGPSPITCPVNCEPTIEVCTSVDPRSQLSALIEHGQPGRRTRATRRAVDLAVGEDRHIALANGAVVVDPLMFEPDRAVAAAEPVVDRVPCRRCVVERPLDRPSDTDQCRQVLRCDREAELGGVGRCVERPAVRDVDRHVTVVGRNVQIGRRHEAGDVLEPHLLHLAGGDVGVDVQPARWNVDPQFGHRGHGVDALESIAHVTPAIVPCPHAVENPSLWKNTMPNDPSPSSPSSGSGGVTKQPYMSAWPRGSLTRNTRMSSRWFWRYRVDRARSCRAGPGCHRSRSGTARLRCGSRSC